MSDFDEQTDMPSSAQLRSDMRDEIDRLRSELDAKGAEREAEKKVLLWAASVYDNFTKAEVEGETTSIRELWRAEDELREIRQGF